MGWTSDFEAILYDGYNNIETRRRMEGLASGSHLSLMVLHSLGATYHWLSPDRKPKDWVYSGVHLGCAVFSAISTFRHIRDIMRYP